MSTELTIKPSYEVKICLTCDKKSCHPWHCKRYKEGMKQLEERGKSNDTIPTSNRRVKPY